MVAVAFTAAAASQDDLDVVQLLHFILLSLWCCCHSYYCICLLYSKLKVSDSTSTHSSINMD